MVSLLIDSDLCKDLHDVTGDAFDFLSSSGLFSITWELQFLQTSLLQMCHPCLFLCHEQTLFRWDIHKLNFHDISYDALYGGMLPLPPLWKENVELP